MMTVNTKQLIGGAMVALALTGCTTMEERFANCMTTYNDSNACMAMEQLRMESSRALMENGQKMMAQGQNNAPQQTTCREQYNGTIQCSTF